MERKKIKEKQIFLPVLEKRGIYLESKIIQNF